MSPLGGGLILKDNCLKYDVECFEKTFWVTARGGGTHPPPPIYAFIHSHNMFWFNNIVHLLVHSAQVSEIRPLEPLVLFVKKILQLGKVNIMGNKSS